MSLTFTRLLPRKWLCLEVLIHLPQPDECPRRGEGTTHRLRVTRELVGQHGFERRDHAPASAQLAGLVSVMGSKRCFHVRSIHLLQGGAVHTNDDKESNETVHMLLLLHFSNTCTAA